MKRLTESHVILCNLWTIIQSLICVKSRRHTLHSEKQKSTERGVFIYIITDPHIMPQTNVDMVSNFQLQDGAVGLRGGVTWRIIIPRYYPICISVQSATTALSTCFPAEGCEGEIINSFYWCCKITCINQQKWISYETVQYFQYKGPASKLKKAYTDLSLGCNVLQCWSTHVCTPEGKKHLQDQWCHLLVMQQKMQPEATLTDINMNNVILNSKLKATNSEFQPTVKTTLNKHSAHNSWFAH